MLLVASAWASIARLIVARRMKASRCKQCRPSPLLLAACTSIGHPSRLADYGFESARLQRKLGTKYCASFRSACSWRAPFSHYVLPKALNLTALRPQKDLPALGRLGSQATESLIGGCQHGLRVYGSRLPKHFWEC